MIYLYETKYCAFCTKKINKQNNKKKFKPKTERKMFIYQIADKERTLNQSN